MNSLPEFALRNKRAIVFAALLLSLAGFYLVFQIPQGVFPDATFPRITVLVDYGLAPLKQMEIEIVKPIEEAVKMVPGVQAVRSVTNRGSSEINIHFDWNEDMFQAYQLVQAQMGSIQGALPPGVEINIRRLTTSTFPVAGYSLYSDSLDLVQLRDLAIYTLRPQLADIPGIFNIEVVGGEQREYRVILDPEKLAAYNLDYRQVSETLQKTNSVEFVGRLNEYNKLYLNVSDNRYVKMQDIGNTVIANRYPTPIVLSDIAVMEPAVQETFIRTRSNFKDAVLVNIVIQPGTNSVEIMKQVEARLKEVRQTIPRSVVLRKWYDLSEFIKTSIKSVYESIFLGAALTMLILLLFLRRFRITLVTALIIPIALLISFIFMKLAGMDLNLMSLGGLAASIGILVDNAIVVVENIERYLEQGFSRKDAVIKATGEIIPPLIGATMTTLVVFVPLVFLGGIPGIFFRPLAGTLAISIGVSMLLAMFLTPALAALLISTEKKSPGRVMPRIVAFQQRVLRFNLKRPVFTIAIILLLAAIAVFSYLKIPSGFLPEWDEGTIVLDFNSPSGSSVEGTYALLQSIEEHLKEIPEIKNYSLRIGTSLGHPRMPATEGDFLISLKGGPRRPVFEIMDELREFAEAQEPRLEVELFQVLPDRLNSDLAGEVAPIALEVFGNNPPLMQAVAQQLADSLEKVPNVVDVYRGFQAGESELTIRVIPEAAALYGLTVEDVNRSVRMALWGETTTEMVQGLKIIPVSLRYSKTRYSHLENILKLPLYLPEQNRVLRLEEIAEFQKTPGLADVYHDNLSLAINVTGQISGRDLGGIVKDVQKMLRQTRLPPGISVRLGGQYHSQQQAFSQLFMILIFGALLVFTILLFEFKSFKTSAVIMIGTVLAVSGVFLMLWITRIPLDISAFMGMIMIIGVVVNNGILVIDFTESYLKETSDIAKALLTACQVRLRPILMTTLSTIIGFLPLSLAMGQGAEMLQPLAISMIGGMCLSLLLSLLVIPTLYYLVYRKQFGTGETAFS